MFSLVLSQLIAKNNKSWFCAPQDRSGLCLVVVDRQRNAKSGLGDDSFGGRYWFGFLHARRVSKNAVFLCLKNNDLTGKFGACQGNFDWRTDGCSVWNFDFSSNIFASGARSRKVFLFFQIFLVSFLFQGG